MTPIELNIIRTWPDGFAARLEHVWKDMVGFIPSYKLYDLQRVLAEFGLRMEVFENARPAATTEMPRWVCLEGMNKDELDAYDYGCRGMEHALRQVLEGKDTGEGVSVEPWESLRRRVLALMAPIDMVLYCPKCGMQHIDEPEVLAKVFACHHADPMACDCDNKRWVNPPHRSHLCHGCDHVWRPADVPTNGVRAVTTVGKADSPLPATPPSARDVVRQLLFALQSTHPYVHGWCTIQSVKAEIKRANDAAHRFLQGGR
jgi:hypothetical protein